MQYQVLARKWRPQNFHEIVGQEHVSRTLLNALESGRIAHAFLFSGPRGCGKTSAARILAKALNCHTGEPGEPCGTCPSCIEIAAGNCIDVVEIDAASNTGVDNVRQLIEQARYQPARDRYKIFIIDEVHMLSNQAFSALLKTLEEPPSHVAFIMATTEYHKIPATILSRCQQYSFKLIPYPKILERLRTIAQTEKIEIGDSALEQVVFSSGGSMRDAMSALDQVIAFSGDHVKDDDVMTLLGLIEPKILERTVKAIALNDTAAILEQVGELVESGQDLQGFCRLLLGQFRNLMVLKAGVSDPTLLGVPESLLPYLKEQAALFSREDLLRLFDALLKVDASIKYATQMRFQLEMGLIELAHIAKLRPLEELIAEFSSLAEGSPAEPRTGRVNTDPAVHLSQTPTNVPSGRTGPVPRKGTGAGIPSETGTGKAPTGGHTVNRKVESSNAEGISGDLLNEIASAVGREALESLLRRLKGARLREDRILLDIGSPNEFFRNQIKSNISLIEQAAEKVVGRKVEVLLEEVQPSDKDTSDARKSSGKPSEPDILEKAKQEPVVQSFLDVFPGQVEAEKIDS